MYKIAVFVSGRGSNLKAILNFISETKSMIEIVAVVSDKINCPAFDIAKLNSIKTYSVSQTEKDGFILYIALLKILQEMKTDLIVLAGYLKKIPDELIDEYENQNLLLPKLQCIHRFAVL